MPVNGPELRVTDLVVFAAWTTSRVHSRPSRPGARPPGRCRRIRRWRPTRRASRPRWRSSASGWRRSYPFHHPRYAGQMLKPPHPVAIAAYTAAMHVNANNHALDGGPATSALEVEVDARPGARCSASRTTRSAT